MGLKQVIDFEGTDDELKKAVDEGMEMAEKFKQSLINVAVEKKVIDVLKGYEKVKDVIGNPMKLVSIARELDIPISPYLGADPKYFILKDFIWNKLTPEGTKRIKDMGEYYFDEGYNLERAEMLVDIGKNKSIASLYTELNINDLVLLYHYEEEHRK